MGRSGNVSEVTRARLCIGVGVGVVCITYIGI